MNETLKTVLIFVSLCLFVLGIAFLFTNLSMNRAKKKYAEIKKIISSDERALSLYKTALSDNYLHRLEINIIFTEYIKNNYEDSDRIIEILMVDDAITLDEINHLSFDATYIWDL